MSKPIYLDYAAATPLSPKAYAAMKPYFVDRFYNPSAGYQAAKLVGRDIEQARARAAHWVGARPGELIFTAGGTEANNLAISGVMRHYPGKHLLVSSVEHDSVLEPAKQFKHSLVPVRGDGRLELEALEASITPDTVLISIMYANNEVGTVQPLRQAAKIITKVRKARTSAGNNLPLYLHTDACQAGLYLDLHAHRLGVDLMTLNGGKIYGPKQSGLLVVKSGTQLDPQILGGGQENGQRSGTENVAGIIGLATALDEAQAERTRESQRLSGLRDDFIQRLTEIKDLTINGSLNYRLPNNIHLSVSGQDNERLMMELDEAGIQCAVGSACSASDEEPSHVLLAMGLSEAEARSSLRFSLGKSTTKSDIDFVVKTLKKLL